MREATGDLFDLEADAICITTNGFVNAQGANTMGQGCAGEAKVRWPGIQLNLGHQIREFGNHVFLLTHEAEGFSERFLHGNQPLYSARIHKVPYHVISFPTKEHWRDPAIPQLIERSAEELLGLTQAFDFESVLLPRPGCGERTGQLDWDDVRPILHGILDDRFTAVTFE